MKNRHTSLDKDVWLNELQIPTTGYFWRRYKPHLNLVHTNDPKERDEIIKQMSRGWCIGGKDYKKAIAEDIKKNKKQLHLEQIELRELNELLCEQLIERYLSRLRKTETDIKNDKKSVEWKLAIALRMKETTSVKNSWLAHKLNMGITSGMSKNLSIFKRELQSKSKDYKRINKL